MPLVVFGCAACADQRAVRLTLHVRAAGHPDYMLPHPRCSCTGQPMSVVQIDYAH